MKKQINEAKEYQAPAIAKRVNVYEILFQGLLSYE